MSGLSDWMAAKGIKEAAPDPKFDAWMKKVDAAIEKKVGFGVTHADLPDVCYDDMYEDGYTPSSAAKAAIAYANEN